MRRTLSSAGVIAVLVLTLIVPGPRPVQADDRGLTAPAIAAICTGAVVGGGLFAYLAYTNRPSNPDRMDWTVQGPGGFFAGLFLGASFVPSSSWSYSPHAIWTSLPQPPTSEVSQSPMKYQPGVVGGLKLGYYFHRFPYFGLEGELNFTRNDIRKQSVSINPPVFGAVQAIAPTQSFYVLTLALHLLGRYGFLKDEEVPFGRLQPYVGLGPGFVVIYGQEDSAKNLSLEALAGVRYMLFKNLSCFVEYKFSQQWGVELLYQKLQPPVGLGYLTGRSTFDFTSHKVVVGVSVHFW